jgi:hypothetical protein
MYYENKVLQDIKMGATLMKTDPARVYPRRKEMEYWLIITIGHYGYLRKR